MADKPPMPRGLGASGRKLWKATTGEFLLSEHETGLLLQACCTADALDALQATLDVDGPLDESPQGRKVHPALRELRQQRIAYARLIARAGPADGRRRG